MALTGTATAGAVTGLPQAILNVYSREIQHRALPAMRFEQFAVIKDELTRQPGLTIYFTIYENLALGGPLTEGVNMTTQAMTASQVFVTVTEYGNAIAISELLLQSSYDDVLTEAAYQLGRDYARVTDLLLRNAVMASANTIGAGGAWPLSNISQPLRMDDLRAGVERLYTLNVPKFNGDFFACFVHPHQVSSLKRDPEWVSASSYGATEQLFRGELGRFDDVRFVGTGHMNNGAVLATDPAYDATLVAAGAGGINLYKAVLMGDNSYAWAVGLPVEMRDNGVEDFGRKHSLGWYSIMGSKIINGDNILPIVSA
jgi:N4-gp56 family major capsid protein